jgi:hypothetical protein
VFLSALRGFWSAFPRLRRWRRGTERAGTVARLDNVAWHPRGLVVTDRSGLLDNLRNRLGGDWFRNVVDERRRYRFGDRNG